MEDAHISELLPGVRVYRVPEGPSLQSELISSLEDTERRPAEAVRFLFIGRLDVFTKGLDTLFSYGGKRESSGFGDRVSFTGSLSPKEVNAALDESDLRVRCTF